MPPRSVSRLFQILLAGVCLASLGPLSPTLPAAGASVSGTVVTREGSRVVPIFRATIIARQAGGSETLAVTRTDREGRFLMVDLSSPRLQLSVLKNGFYTRTINGRENDQVVLDCTRAEDCAAVAFELGPSASVMGMVVDEMGEPLSDVAVLAVRGDLPSDQRGGFVGSDRQTDDRGYFRIAGLKPGNYKVKAQGEYGRMGRPRELESDPVDIEIAEGAELQGVRLNVRVGQPDKTFTVSGKVTGVDAPGDEAFRSIQLRGLDRERRRGFGGYQSGERVGNDGSFQLNGVRAGRYAVRYISVGQNRRDEDFRSLSMGTIDVTGDMKGLMLSPVPATGLAGTVKFETERVPQDAMLYVTSDQEFVANARITAPDFKFRLDNLTSAKHDISVTENRRGPARFYIKGIRRGTELVAPRDLVFPEGTVENVEIIVSDEMARIYGRVKMASEPGAAQPVRKAAQYQVGLSGPNRRIQLIQTDQYGSFHFDDIVPGDYKICAWENVDLQGIYDDSTWEKAGSAVRKFPVEAGNDIEIDLTAVP